MIAAGLGVRTHIIHAKSGMITNLGEFGWDGAAGTLSIVDPDIGFEYSGSTQTGLVALPHKNIQGWEFPMRSIL